MISAGRTNATSRWFLVSPLRCGQTVGAWHWPMAIRFLPGHSTPMLLMWATTAWCSASPAAGRAGSHPEKSERPGQRRARSVIRPGFHQHIEEALLDRHGLVKRRRGRRNRAKGTPLSRAGRPNDLVVRRLKGRVHACRPVILLSAHRHQLRQPLSDRLRSPLQHQGRLCLLGVRERLGGVQSAAGEPHRHRRTPVSYTHLTLPTIA